VTRSPSRRGAARFVVLLLAVALLVPTIAMAQSQPVPGPWKNARVVKPGVQVLVESKLDLIKDKKVGIITNPTGVMADLQHEVDYLANAPGVNLVAVFGPEHGFRGTAQAGGSEGFYIDPKTGLPVYDTYGKSGNALKDIFIKSGVDVVMFDIQDAGSRFYTYIWTMSDSMEAAALAGKDFIVLDRPNPISGIDAEGPVLDPAFSTFVGRYAISQRHGMSVGELAQMFNEEFLPARTGGLKVNLTVVPMEGWSRDMYYEDTGLPWIMPSPNMPTVDTAVVYPGTCYFEGTNLSEGRGTTRPFELIGAPYIDGRLAEAMNALKLPGVMFREAYFTPTFSKWVNKPVGGVQLFVTDRRSFDPIRTALNLIIETKKLYPNDFAWRSDNWIDKLSGSSYVRTSVDAGMNADEIIAGWQDGLGAFKAMRAKYLIYTQTRGQGLYR